MRWVAGIAGLLRGWSVSFSSPLFAFALSILARCLMWKIWSDSSMGNGSGNWWAKEKIANVRGEKRYMAGPYGIVIQAQEYSLKLCKHRFRAVTQSIHSAMLCCSGQTYTPFFTGLLNLVDDHTVNLHLVQFFIFNEPCVWIHVSETVWKTDRIWADSFATTSDWSGSWAMLIYSELTYESKGSPPAECW